MYDFIRGCLAEKTASYVVIDTESIGYKIHVPVNYCNQLPEIGVTVKLYTSWVIRELSQTLYGFFEKAERELFEQLLSISGIGPKTSLALMGHYTPKELERIVQNGEIASLARVPGIGKKTAEKLLVDLKNRLKLTVFTQPLYSTKEQDAVSALLNLGCSQSIAEKAIQKAQKELSHEADLATLIATALKLQK